MNAGPGSPNSVVSTLRPPQLIQSLVNGFNAVANHISLLLLPIALDLLLWLGPHLRVKTLFEPVLQEMLAFMRQNSAAEMQPLMAGMEELWSTFLEQYNLLTTLNTFPIGVPSQMAGILPVQTPFGAAPIYEISSPGIFLLGWLVFTLVGFGLASLYFTNITRTSAQTCPEPAQAVEGTAPVQEQQLPAAPERNLAWKTFQVIAMVLLLIAVLVLLLIPTVLVAGLISLASPMLAQIALLVFTFSMLWMMIPLVFSPHGIFLCGQNVLSAMLTSMRVVRTSMPTTGLFLLMVIVLNQGLGLLWRSAPDTSWLGLVGIFGHAFVSTGLLAASFFYYRSGLTYMLSLRTVARQAAR